MIPDGGVACSEKQICARKNLRSRSQFKIFSVMKSMHKLIVVLSLLGLSARGLAQGLVWNPTPPTMGGSGVWNTTSPNWWDGSANQPWSLIEYVAMFGGPAGVVTVAPGITARGVQFDAATGGYYVLQGAPLAIGSAGIYANETAVIAAPIVIYDTAWDYYPNWVVVANGKTLTLAGNIANEDTLAAPLSVGGAGTVIISGVLQTNANVGLFVLEKYDSGTLALASQGNSPSAINIYGGLFRLDADSAITSGVPVRVYSGGTFDFNGRTNVNYLNFTIEGSGNAGQGALYNSSAVFLAERTRLLQLALSGDAVVGGIGRWDIGPGAGSMLDGGYFNLTKVGPNDISCRPQFVTNLNSLTIQDGMWYFEGNSQPYITNTVVYVQPKGRLGSYGNVSHAPQVVLNGGRLVNAGGGAATWTGPFTINSNSTVNTVDNYGNGNITITSNFTGTAGVTVIGGNSANTVTLGGLVSVAGITNASLSTVLISGTNDTTSGPVVNLGPGLLAISGTNLSTSPVIVGSNAVVRFDSPNSLGQNIILANSNSVAAAGYAIDQNLLNSINANSTGVVALATNSGSTLDFGALGSGAANLSLGSYGSNAFTGSVLPYNNTFQLGGGGGILNIASPLTGAGNSAAIGSISSNGTVLLSAANTLGGPITVWGGTLRLGVNTALPAGTVVDVKPNATFDMNGINNTANYSLYLAGNGVNNIGALYNNVVLHAALAMTNLTLTGDATVNNPTSLDLLQTSENAIFNGNGYWLTKIGAGNLDFRNYKFTNLGGIRINQGLVYWESVSPTLAGVPIVVNPGATLSHYNGYGAGNIFTNNATLILNGGNLQNYGGGSNLVGGRVAFTGPVNVRSNSFINDGSVFLDRYEMYLANNVTGPGGLTISASYPVVFLGNVTLGGGITLLGTNRLVFDNATLNSGVVQIGSGTVVLTNNTVVSAPISINGGILRVDTAAAVPAGRLVRINPGSGYAAGYPINQAFLNSVDTGSMGAILIASNSSQNLDFTQLPNVSLGSVGSNTYSGTITPHSSGYRLGGGGQLNMLNVNALTGSRNLTVVPPGLVQLSAANNISGALRIAGGALELYGANNTLAPTLNSYSSLTVEGGAPNFFGEFPYPYQKLKGGILGVNELEGDRFGGKTVVLAGGSFVYRGWNKTASAPTGIVNTVILTNGYNTLASVPYSTDAAGPTNWLVISNLVLSTNATVEFRSQGGVLGANTKGSGNIRVVNVNGAAIANVTNILGPWALASGATGMNTNRARYFATNHATQGIMVGAPDYTVTSSSTLANANATNNVLASDNTSGNAPQTINGGTKTIYTLTSERDVLLTNGATLVLNGGGLIMRQNNHWIKGGSGAIGKITSAFSNAASLRNQLYLHTPDDYSVGAGTNAPVVTDLQIQVQINNNGSTPLMLIKDGVGAVQLTTQSNGFTGGTFIHGGRLQVGHQYALGTGPVTVFPGGQVWFTANNTPNALNIAGIGCQEASGFLGAVRLSNNITNTGAVTLLGDARVTVWSTDLGALNGSIAGAFNLEKTGTGTLVLGASNAFGGNLYVNAGTIRVLNANSLGDTVGATYINNGGTLDVNGVALANELIVLNGGTLVNNGAAQINAVNRLLVAANSIAAGPNRWDVRNGWLTVNSNVVLTVNGGYLGLIGQNTNWGTIILTNGTLSLESGGYYGNGTYMVNAGTLQLWSGNQPVVVPQPFVFNGGTLYNGNSFNQINGTVTLSNNITVGSATTAGALTINGNISGPGGMIVNLATNIGNILVLRGNNTFQGSLMLNVGRVALMYGGNLAGSTNIQLAANTVLDASGRTDGTLALAPGQALGGSGTVVGQVAMNSGSALNPGGLGVVGTLSLANNLTLNGGVTVNMELSVDPSGLVQSNDQVVVAGNLSLGGANTILITPVGGTLSPGTYKLIRYNGTLAGGVANLTVAFTTPPSGRGLSYALSDATPGEIDLVVTAAGVDLTWVGDGTANVWDLQGTANFNDGNGPSVFYQGDRVVFGDTGSASPAINLGFVALPGSVRFEGAQNYVVNGPGRLSGGMSLYRTGTGTVRIDTLNDFSGPVVLSGGVLEVTNVANAGTASPMGLGSVATNFWVMDGGTFRYLGPPPAGGLNRGLTVGAGGATFDLPAYWLRLDINGDVAGPGSIIKKGAGALLMGAGKNNVFFMGDAIVSQGFLRLRSNGSLGTNGTVYLNDANTGAMDTGFLLDADAGVWDFRRPIVINNQGTGVTYLGSTNASGNRVSFWGDVVMNKPVTLIGSSTDRTTFMGILSGNVGRLTVTGGQRITFGATNTFVGDVVLVGAGTILQPFRGDNPANFNGDTIPDSSSVELGSGTILQLATDETINGLSGWGIVRPIARDAFLTVGSGGASSTFLGTITDNTYKLHLVKAGAGTLTLGGASTGTGNVLVNGGTVALMASASLANAPVLQVGGGGRLDVSAFAPFNLNVGQTLGGDGVVTGDVAAVGAYLNPGTNGVAGTLSFSNSLTMGGGTTNYIDLSNTNVVGGGTNDLLVVAGDLNLSGTNYLLVNNLTNELAVGVYTIIQYGGALVGGASNFVVVGLGTNTHYQFAVLDNVTNEIRLAVTGGPSSLKWVGGQGGNNWDVGATTNWSSNGLPAVYYDLDAVTFDDSASAFVPVLVGTLSPGSVVVNANTPYVFGGSGRLAGGMSLYKGGTGTLTINNTNTFNGVVYVTNGVLRFGNNAALGSTNGATYVLGNGTLDINGFSSGGEPVFVSGAGFNGAGAIINNSATADSTQGFSDVTLLGDTYFGGSRRWDFRLFTGGSNPGLRGNGYKLTKVGGNYIAFQNGVAPGWNLDLGDVDIVQGTISIEYWVRLGNPNKTLTVYQGAVFQPYNLNTNTPVDRAIVIQDNGVLFGNGTSGNNDIITGPITIYGNAQFDAASGVTLTLSNGVSGPGNFVRRSANAGTVLLAGTNTYTGNTIVNQAMSVSGVISNSGMVSVNSTLTLIGTGELIVPNITLNGTINAVGRVDGAFALKPGAVLAGNGSILGNFSDAAGASIIPGGVGVVGALQYYGQFNLQGGGNLVYDINNTTDFNSNDRILAGDVVLSGVTRLSFNFLPGAPVLNQPYTLIKYSGTLSGSPANLAISTRLPYVLDMGSVPGEIRITFTGTATAGDLLWVGDGTANVWDLAGAQNWFNRVSSAPDVFFNYDSVRFDDTGSDSPAVNLTGALSPSQIVVSNISKSYTFSGSGSLNGSGNLIKQGAGLLTLQNNNYHTGSNALAGGTVAFSLNGLGSGQIGFHGGTLRWLPGNLADISTRTVTIGPAGGTLDVGANDIVLNGSIGNNGAGSLTKVGTGSLMFRANHTYAGDTIIQEGTLRLGNNNVIADGAGRGNLVIGAGALLDLNGYSDTINGLSGAGTVDNLFGGGIYRLTIGANNAMGNFSGVIQNTSGTVALSKTGTGTNILANQNQHVGDTTISQGWLQAGAQNIISNSYLVNVITNGVFDLGGFDQAIRALAGTGVITNSGASATLTVGTDGTTSVFGGSIRGPTTVAKVGGGDLVLGNYSTYTSGTRIDAGRVVAAWDNALGSGPIILNGGVLSAGTAGLREGRLSGAFNTTDPNPGTAVVPNTRYANIPDASPYMATGGAWADNTTYVYSGYLNNTNTTNVTWTFGKNFDDSVLLKIDGVTLINSGTWNAPVIATYVLTPGLHTFELRLGQGGGGVGPNVASWWTTTAFGFGYDPQGRNQTVIGNYMPMADPGDGSLFVLAAGGTLSNAVVLSGNSEIQVQATNSSLTLAGQLTGSGALTKTGQGALIVSGANVYSGNTTNTGGELHFSTVVTNNAVVAINDSSVLGIQVAAPGSTFKANELVLGQGGTVGLQINLGLSGNPTAPVADIGTLHANGNILLTISGNNLSVGQFTLVKYQSLNGNGFGAFQLAGLPPRVTAILVDNIANQSIDLQIQSVDYPKWVGDISANWDINTTTNWRGMASGNRTTYQEIGGLGDQVLFDDSALGSTTVNLATVLSPSQLILSNAVWDYTFSGAGRLNGNFPFYKYGGKMLILNLTSNTSFTGPIYLNEGMLRVAGSSNSLGDVNAPLYIADGATLDINALNMGDKKVYVSGAGLGGLGAIYNSAGSPPDLWAVKWLTLLGDTTINAPSARWDICRRGGQLRGNGYALIKIGANVVDIGSAGETDLGDIYVMQGSLYVDVSTTLGRPGNKMCLSPGTLFQSYATGPGNPLNKNLFMTNATYQSPNSGSITNWFVGPVTLFGTNNIDCQAAVNGLVMANGISGDGALNKINPGVLILYGTNSYTGSTLVSGGLLVLSNTASISNSAIIYVASGASLVATTRVDATLGLGAQTLAGAGTVWGAVSAGAGASINPGNVLGAGTLVIAGNLTLTGGTLYYDLANVTNWASNDQLIVSNLTLSGTTLLAIDFLNGAPVLNQPYTIIRYNNTLSGGPANFTVVSRFPAVVDTTTRPGEVLVTFTGGAAAGLVWQGDGINNIWDAGTTYNWLNGGVPDRFFNGDRVIFNDSGSASPAVALGGLLTPSALEFNNVLQTYTLAGSGSLGGNIGLRKSSTGTLIIANNNLFTGTTTNAAGTLQLGNGGADGNVNGPIANDGLLIFNRTVNNTFGFVISGSGAVRKENTNILVLSGANTFAGNVTVAGGILRLGNTAALGSTAGYTEVLPGATLDLNGQIGGNVRSESYVLAGDGFGGLGALYLSTGTFGNDTCPSNVVLAGDTTMNVAAGAQLRISRNAEVQGNFVGNGYALTKKGLGGLYIVYGRDTDLGDIHVREGMLVFDNRVTMGRPTNTTYVYSNATLQLFKPFTNYQRNLVIDNGIFQLNGDTGTYSFALTGQAFVNGVARFDVIANTANVLSLSNVMVSGPGTVYKTGIGELHLFGTNTFSGGLSVGGGIVRVSHYGLGSGPAALVAGGTQLVFQQGFDGTVNNPIGGVGGTITLSIYNPPTLNLTFAGQISGGIGLTASSGRAILTADNNFTGAVTINNGVVQARHNNALGGSAVTLSAASTGRLELGGGITMSRPVTLNGRGSTIGDTTHSPLIVSVDGDNIITGALTGTTAGSNYIVRVDSGSLTLSSGFTPAASGDHALILGGAGNATVPVALNDNGAGRLHLYKTGAGALTLQAANNYSGNTVVQGGQLVLAAGSGVANSPVIYVGGGAQLDVSAVSGGLQLASGKNLAGEGTVIGDVTASTGAGIVPGMTNIPGTLTLNNNLTLNNANLLFDLSPDTTPGSGTNDLLVVAGDLTASGVNIINVSAPGGGLVPGTYKLVTYTGNGNFTPANFMLAGTNFLQNTRLTAALAFAAGEIDLVVSGTASALVWVGNNGNNWDLAGTINWNDGMGASRFYNMDSVLFDDTSANFTPTLVGNLAPTRVVVDSAGTYTFGGAGVLYGGMDLIKTNTGTLVINTANSFLGPVQLNSGVLRVGNSSALGNPNGPTYINPAGVLDVNGIALGSELIVLNGGVISNSGAAQINALMRLGVTADSTITGPNRWDVRGAGSWVNIANGVTLNKVSTGQVSFVSSAITNYGTINVNQGLLGIEAGATTVGSGPVNVAAGATLQYWGPQVQGLPVNLNGGTLRAANSASTNTSVITVNQDSVLDTTQTLGLTGTLAGSGNLNKTGGNELQLYGSGVSMTGFLTNSAGVIRVFAQDALPLNVVNNATIGMQPGPAQTITYSGRVTGSGSFNNATGTQGTTIITGAITNSFGMNGGTLQVSDGGVISGVITLSNQSQFIVGSNGLYTGSGVISAGTVQVLRGGVFQSGDLVVGQNDITNLMKVEDGGTLTFTNGSTLTVGNKAADNTNVMATLDLSAMPFFTANLANLRIGYCTGNTGFDSGVMLLATNNVITASAQVVVGYSDPAGDIAPIRPHLRLGAGSNVILTPNLSVALRKIAGTISNTLGGSLVLSNTSGRTDLMIASNGLNTGTFPTGIVDLAYGPVTAYLDNLVIGYKAGGGNGGAEGVFALGNQAGNWVDVNNVTIGLLNTGGAAGSRGTGTLLMSNGTLTVNNNVNLGSFTGSLGTASGALNLYGGLVNIKGDILGNSSSASTSTVLVAGATVDMMPIGDTVAGNIGTAANPVRNLIVQSGVLRNVGEINGGTTPLSLTSGGTLALEGNNTYTGATLVTNSTLVVNGTLGASANGVTVAGGVLKGTGTVNRPVTMLAGSVLYPADNGVMGTLTVGANLSLGGTTVMEIDRANPSGSDRIAGAGAVTYGGTLNVINVGAPLEPGDRFVLFDRTAYAGWFAATNLPALDPQLRWDVSQLGVDGSITVLAVAPNITQQPASQLATFGGDVELSVIASGYQMRYQWYLGTNPIAGATNSSLSLTNISCEQEGVYTVVITNYGNVVTSAAALISIEDTLPQLTQPPLSRTNNVGSESVFTVAATPCHLTYQWLFNNNPIPDATNTTYTISSVQMSDAGDYAVVVSNSAGVVTSAVATLTVNRLPVAGDLGVATTRDQPVRIARAKLVQNAADPDGDALAVSSFNAVSLNGGTIVGTLTHLIYTPPAGYTGSDQFDFTISDGRGGYATAHVQIMVAAAIPAQNQLSLTVLENGHVRIVFAGIPGREYEVQRSTDLLNWNSLGTMQVPLHGILEVIDDNPPLGQAYYRLRSAP